MADQEELHILCTKCRNISPGIEERLRESLAKRPLGFGNRSDDEMAQSKRGRIDAPAGVRETSNRMASPADQTLGSEETTGEKQSGGESQVSPGSPYGFDGTRERCMMCDAMGISKNKRILQAEAQDPFAVDDDKTLYRSIQKLVAVGENCGNQRLYNLFSYSLPEDDEENWDPYEWPSLHYFVHCGIAFAIEPATDAVLVKLRKANIQFWRSEPAVAQRKRLREAVVSALEVDYPNAMDMSDGHLLEKALAIEHPPEEARLLKQHLQIKDEINSFDMTTFEKNFKKCLTVKSFNSCGCPYGCKKRFSSRIWMEGHMDRSEKKKCCPRVCFPSVKPIGYVISLPVAIIINRLSWSDSTWPLLHQWRHPVHCKVGTSPGEGESDFDFELLFMALYPDLRCGKRELFLPSESIFHYANIFLKIYSGTEKSFQHQRKNMPFLRAFEDWNGAAKERILANARPITYYCSDSEDED